MGLPFPTDIEVLADACRPVFDAHPDIRRAYVFGSIADGTSGARSDLDIALVGTKGLDRVRLVDLGYEVVAGLSELFANDRVDVVVLNASENSELRHAVIADGRIVFDRGDDLDAFERQIRHEYEDHRATLARLGRG